MTEGTNHINAFRLIMPLTASYHMMSALTFCRNLSFSYVVVGTYLLAMQVVGTGLHSKQHVVAV